PPMVAPTTSPLAVSTATTCAPNTPLTPVGAIGSDNGFAANTRPRIEPACAESATSGYNTRNPVRSSSDSGASSCPAAGRFPVNVPGPGAYGNIIARHTAEWLNPSRCPSSCTSKDSKSYDVAVLGSADGVANVVRESFGLK